MVRKRQSGDRRGVALGTRIDHSRWPGPVQQGIQAPALCTLEYVAGQIDSGSNAATSCTTHHAHQEIFWITHHRRRRRSHYHLERSGHPCEHMQLD